MLLTADDTKKIADWLNEKCGQMRCVCCGNAIWEVQGFATLPIGFDVHSTRFFYSQGIPQITVACRTCGHLLFFSSAIIGFKPDEPPPMQVPPSENA